MTLIFSIHYFLWYGALTSIFGYESFYARHYTNATTMQYGYLNMVLPFITVLVTPMICSLADRQRSHRSYFTMSLVITTIALSFYALLPLITDTNRSLSNHHPYLDGAKSSSSSNHNHNQSPTNTLLWGPWIYYCITSLICDLAMGINTCLSDSFAVLQAEEYGTSFGRIIVWGTLGLASAALVLSFINQWTALPRLMPGLVLGTFLLTIDVLVVSFWRRSSDFRLDIIPIDAAQTLTGSASSAHKEPSDYLPLNESARINLGIEIDQKDGEPRRKTKSPIEIIVEGNTATSNEAKATKVSGQADLETDPYSSSIKTINSQDVSTENWLANDSRQEVFQPGKGYSLVKTNQSQQQVSPRVAAANTNNGGGGNNNNNNNNNNGDNESNSYYQATSFRMQFILLGLILQRRKSLIRYFILFILSGFFMSMHWNYFFLYLEKIYGNKMELISALSMVGQSILGELPFFILSRKFIQYFGRSHTLSISVISIGTRFLLYGYLLPNVSMYCIALAGCFQGPNYGLFYVVMTEVGLEYSFCDDETIERLAARNELNRDNKREVDSVRLSLRSTVQSVAFACYEGIGVGLGSLAGGWIVASYGFKTLWLSMAIGSISVGLINIVIEFACREHDPEDDQDESKRERREFMEARRMGTLKSIVSPQPIRPPPPTPASDARIPLAPFKFQRPRPLQQKRLEANTRLKVLVQRKSAGGHVAPSAAMAV